MHCKCVLDGRPMGPYTPRVWGPKRAGGRGEMATGAVGPGTCISPAWSAHPLTAQGVRRSLLGRPSLFGPSVPRPCPTDCLLLPPLWVAVVAALPVAALPCPAVPSGTSSSRSFGVAVRRCAPHPAVPMGHPPPLPFGWPVRCCAPPSLALWATSSSHVPWAVPVLVPTDCLLLPPLWGWPWPPSGPAGHPPPSLCSGRLGAVRPRPCPTGYVLLPRYARAVSSLVCHQCRKSKSSIMEGLATHGRK